MTRTRFCDSAAVHALIAAHKRVLAEGGELRLVVPADGAVHRVLTLPGIDHFIHCFASLEEAEAPGVRWRAPAIRSQWIKRGPPSGQVVIVRCQPC